METQQLPTKVQFTLDISPPATEIHQQAELKAKIAYIMTLLEHKIISSSRAEKLLGISRLALINLMSQYGLSILDDSMSLEEFQQEVEQANTILKQYNK
ncbi:MAG TPA: hypothetical protein DCQ51_18300 [Planktothrix sp. UBA8407]|jgi:Uncharacterised protein family (UPF0175).|nr:hypothetical protein [Planktothrix sp. UBA8402]HAO13065.1 hypothetical protein [Planktothrix sp. UBA8407]